MERIERIKARDRKLSTLKQGDEVPDMRNFAGRVKGRTREKEMIHMNIFEALETLPEHRKIYFKYKHKLYFRENEQPANDEEFLKRMVKFKRYTFDSFRKWERTEEYQNLLVLLMETRLIDDVQQAYEAISAKAKEGDEKAVKTMLDLGKEIKALANTARKRMNEKVNKKDEEVEDDLDLDLS